MVNSIHPQPATINQGNGEAHPSLAAGGNSQKVNSSAFEIFKGIALTTAISGTTAFTAYGIKRIYSQGLPEGIGNKIWLGAVCFVFVEGSYDLIRKIYNLNQNNSRNI